MDKSGFLFIPTKSSSIWGALVSTEGIMEPSVFIDSITPVAYAGAYHKMRIASSFRALCWSS